MNKQWGFIPLVAVIAISLVAILMAGAAWYYTQNREAEPVVTVSNFEECATAGYPVTNINGQRMCQTKDSAGLEPATYFEQNTNTNANTNTGVDSTAVGNANSNTNEAIVGGDTDEHGCIPSAGYTWCETKQKCLRVWEEGCDTTTVDTPDSLTYENEENGYTFTIPDGWYVHGTIWLPSEEEPDVSGATEGYALGPQFSVTKLTFSEYRTDVTTQDEFIDTLDDGPDGVLEQGWVVRNSLNMYRALVPAGEATGDVETYYYFDGDTVYILSHYPYSQGSQYTQDFEDMVDSFSVI